MNEVDESTDAGDRSGFVAPILLPDEYNLRGVSILDVWPKPKSYDRLRRAMDIVASAFLIVALSPLMLAVAVAIRLSSRGPVIFRQRRAGLLGKPFTMYKFRSMRPAIADDAELLRHPVGRNGPAFKLARDPRVTAVGRWIRRASIDELPQLFNILKGDMTLVGPRPLPLDEVCLERFSERARLSVVPGLTGLWQVSGRADLPYEEWIELDLYYVQHRSTLLDMQILLRTIPAVLSGKGAY
jgi:lipopolysaccharide/colanic/teichoic acid biosynthesis glycosyltransferase